MQGWEEGWIGCGWEQHGWGLTSSSAEEVPHKNDSGQGSGSRRTACVLGPKGENKATGQDGLREKV